MHYFSADKPISNAKEDKLDRAQYAEKIAESLKSWHGDESLVVSLSGAWGIGKTSLKNLIKESLAIGIENNKQPIVIEFNPWEWSSQHEIPKALLKEIESALRQHFKVGFLEGIKLRFSRKNSAPKIVKQSKLSSRIAKYRIHVFSKKIGTAASTLNSAFSELKTASLVVGILSIPGIIWAESGVVKAVFAALLFSGFLGKWAAELFGNLFPEPVEKSFEVQKKEIRDGLKTLTSNIIVFIDDLDRLGKKDLLEIFQLVKANCDFPNLVFFLLMDYEKTASLMKDDRTHGLDYLEKIIQISLEVPPIEERKITEILDEEIQRLLKKVGIEEKFNQGRWIDLFHQGLKPYFKNLRDVYRYISTANFYFLANSNNGLLEVNPVDLLAIEAIRVFEPEAYEQISSNKFLLTETHDRRNQDDLAKELDKIISKVKPDNQETFKFILGGLFSPIDWVLNGMHYGSSFYGEWNKDTRICARDYFDYYFQFKVPKGNLSAFEKQEILKSIDDGNVFLDKLQDFQKNGNLKIVLSFLDDVKKEIKAKNPSSLISALMVIGEKTDRFEGALSQFDSFTHCCRIIYWYLKENFSEVERYDILSRSFQINKSFTVMSKVISFAEPKDNKEQLFRPEDLENLKTEWLNALKSSLKKDPLFILDSMRLKIIIGAWKAFSKFEEIREWFVQNIESDSKNLLKFLHASIYRSETNTIGSAVLNIHYKIDRDYIEQFTNFETVLQKLNALSIDSLNDNEKVIIELVNETSKEQARPSFFSEPINKDTLRRYSQWLYRDLPVKENVEEHLLQDLDLRKYPTIESLNQVHINAQEFLDWYKQKNPDAFQSGVDFLTKALGYNDDEFFERHGFMQKTREAIQEFKNLKANLAKSGT